MAPGGDLGGIPYDPVPEQFRDSETIIIDFETHVEHNGVQPWQIF